MLAPQEDRENNIRQEESFQAPELKCAAEREKTTDAIALKSHNLPTRRAILSAEELLSLTSIADLRAAYIAKGQQDLELNLLTEVAKQDWDIARRQIFDNRDKYSLPTNYPTNILPDGTKIIGIVHSLKAHPDVFALAQAEIRRYPLLLAEQGLGSATMGGMFSCGIDLPDQLADGLWKSILRTHISFLSSIKTLWRKNIQVLSDDDLAPKSEAGKGIARITNNLLMPRDIMLEEYSLLSLKLPRDVYLPLPEALRLAFQKESGQEYSVSQRRSAYMAYFLKNWNPQESLEPIRAKIPVEEYERIKKEKVFLCGRGHVAEIEFFSREPVIDKRLETQAIHDATILNLGIQQFNSYVAKRLFLQNGANSILAIAEGLTLGTLIPRLLLWLSN